MTTKLYGQGGGIKGEGNRGTELGNGIKGVDLGVKQSFETAGGNGILE